MDNLAIRSSNSDRTGFVDEEEGKAPVVVVWPVTDSNVELLPLHVTFPLFRTFSHVGEVFPMVEMGGLVPIGAGTFQERKIFPVAAGVAWVSFEF